MTWTVTKEEPELVDPARKVSAHLNIRAIIDLDNEQDELKALIVSLQKHVAIDMIKVEPTNSITMEPM